MRSRRNYRVFVSLIICLLFYYLVVIKGNEKLHLEEALNVTSRARSFVTSASYENASKQVNCKALFEGDQVEIDKAVAYDEKTVPISFNSSDFDYEIANCSAFRRKRNYTGKPLSDEEEQFPLAFTIMMQNEVLEVERLLRALYMPQNFYCIHVDGKEPLETHRLMRKYAKCFHNVIVVNPVVVTYSGVSQLTEELLCIRELLRVSPRWKYYLNVAAQEFPLKTNLEFVKILKIYYQYDKSEVEQYIHGLVFQRTRFKFFSYYNSTTNLMKLVKGNTKKSEPPNKLTLWKSSRYGAFSRSFLEFVMSSHLAKELLIWLSDSINPDEAWWGTLYAARHNVSKRHKNRAKTSSSFLARAVIWRTEEECRGKFVRDVCVLGIGDLQTLQSKFNHRFFANKFYRDYQPTALDCLEEYHQYRTHHPQQINLNFYQNHVRKTVPIT